MRIKQLKLTNFGPFRSYTIDFKERNEAYVLLTGKNNEGKTHIVKALRLLDAALRVIGKRQQQYCYDDDIYYKLLQQDTDGLLLGRMIYNYHDVVGTIKAVFSNNFRVTAYINPMENTIYADYNGKIPGDARQIFGFIPTLGPLSEEEEIISRKSYLKACLNTSLAPRHLRNHFYQILDAEEFSLIQDIINSSWEGIELLGYKEDYSSSRLFYYFKEGRIERELCWAGQGLQVWFQIITHLVRLRSSSILILDEPEINLHPEKQNDLIRIIKEHFDGSVIIATHSVELINNVDVSHIINVQKAHNKPKLKSTNDRVYLDLVRSQIGSNFNLIASQFEDFDVIIFTEDTADFVILKQIADMYGIKRKAFNIPFHGFSEYKKATVYKEVYEKMIGKKIDYTLVLDRDYYPEVYLEKIKKEIEGEGIRVLFTPGKEIENLFLMNKVLLKVVPPEHHQEFQEFWDELFSDDIELFGTFLTLHGKFLDRKLDPKTVIIKYGPVFRKCWADKDMRYKIIGGKDALHKLRGFFQSKLKRNLQQKELVQKLVSNNKDETEKFVKSIFHLQKPIQQILHY